MPINWNGLKAGLAPGYADLITSVVGPLSGQYTVQQGYRSIVEQNAAFSLGRDANGNVIDKSKVVTNARGGQSPHNYGLAVDVYPVVGGAVDYGFTGGSPEPSAAALPAWEALWSAVRASGQLTTGADFILASGQYDPGHIELNNWKLFENTPIPADALPPEPGADDIPVIGMVDDGSGETIDDGSLDDSAIDDSGDIAGADASSGFNVSVPTILALAAVGGILYMAMRGKE